MTANAFAPELADLDALNARLQTYPLPTSLRSALDADWEVTHTFHSNAIEGNTLSLAETKAVLLDGVTVSGHPLREHLEAVNHREAWRQMRRMASGTAPVTEQDVLDLHRTILTGIQSDDAGVYRRERVRVVGSTLIFPNPLKVPELMAAFVAGLDSTGRDETGHPVLQAARAHYGLVAIHPFIDGNGRTARLLMNLLLIRAGYPPALISVAARAEYYAALEEANGGQLAPFERLVLNRVQASVQDLLNLHGDGEP